MEATRQENAASVHKTQMSGARMVFIGAIVATVLFVAWGVIKMIL